jgi:hypothetical protein
MTFVVSILILLFSISIGYLFSKRTLESLYQFPNFIKTLSDSAIVVMIAFLGVLISLLGTVTVIFEGSTGILLLGIGFGIMLSLFPINKDHSSDKHLA